MNATLLTPVPSPDKAGSFTQPSVDISMIAQLAFARAGDDSVAEGRHLALLPIESLELDLSDPAQCQFGDYELLELIGEGGMGVVYRARQRSLDREVAIKLLAAGVWASTEFVERFRREAQNAARMQHPNIVPVYEVGDHDGLHFFSMRLIGGPSLASELRREKKLSPQRAAQLLRTIAEAVDYAHRLGVLHLDLKPANVLVDENGIPHVADFGLARRVDSALAADNDEVSGTPSYMAPEQASPRTHRITRATDIWGLGAILYELVTGEPPFLAHSPQETLKLVVEGSLRSPRRYAPNLPRDLEAIILRCMAYDVGERYTSARDLADDLNRFLEGRAVRARPLNAAQRAVRWARREPKLAAAVVAAFAALLAGLVATTQQWRRADANAAAALHTAWSQRIDAIWQAYERMDSFAALPRLVANLREQEAAGAHAEAATERRRLGILFANNPRLIDVIAMGGSLVNVAVSADGKRVAAVSRRPETTGASLATLHLIDAETGAVMWHLDVERNFEWLEFSGDGRTLFLDANRSRFAGYKDGDVMRRIGVDDGSELPLPFDVPAPRLVLFAVDGDATLVVAGNGVMQMRRSLAANAAIAWSRPFDPGARLALSDDGSMLLYASGEEPVRYQLIDAATGRVQGGFTLASGELMKQLRVARDGSSVAVATEKGRLVVVSRDGAKERIVPQRCEDGFDPIAYSNDTTLLAATCNLHTSVWSLRDLKPAMRPVDHEEHPWSIALDAQRRTLFTHEAGNPRVYELPPDVDPFSVAMLATPLMVSRTERDYWSSAFDAEHGLLALGTRTGLLKLWRVPTTARLPVNGAPIAPPDLAFDGERLVAVRVFDAFVVDAADGHALGPALTHPDPVWFAETLPDDGVLTASGRELHVWNGRSGAPRFAPLTLANTPWRVIPSPDGGTVLTSIGEYRDGRCRERLQLWRMADGALAAETDVPGPLEGARFAADGSRLLGWRGNEVWLRDAATLAGPSLSVRHADADGPVDVVDAHLSGVGELQAVTRRRNINYAAYFWRWDARDGTLRERLPLAGMAHRFASTPAGSLAIYAYQGVAPLQVQRRTAGAPLEWLPLPRYAETAPGLAYDRTHSVLAQTPDNGALLVDVASGSALSPLLPVSLLGNDRPSQLAFDPSGRRLRGRSAYGRLLHWDVAPDTRALADLAREADLHSERYDAGWIVSAPPLPFATRAALRARDPGPPRQAVEEKPFDPGATVLPRAPEMGAQQLDLGRYYTPLPDRQNDEHLFDVRSVPIGRQRFLGVDFDVRGVIQLSGEARPPTTQTFAERVDGIALPAHAAALLMLVGEYSRDQVVRQLDVVFHYRDGGESRAEFGIRGSYPYPFPADADPLGEAESWRGARIAWLGDLRAGSSLLTQRMPIYLLRAANPQPERELATLSLVARAAPFVLAITVETTATSQGDVP